MKKLLILFVLLSGSLAAFAQDKTADEIKSLSDNKQYDKIISQYASKNEGYSAKSLYYIGLAYYMKEDDNNSIKFMDLSIVKDANDPSPHYIKASTLSYMNKYEEAVKSYQKAISLKPGDAGYYSGLGDLYYNLKKYDLALEAYNKATMQAKCPDRPYSMIAQIYSDREQAEKALEAYYVAKSKILKTSDSYINTLFNIGLFESKLGNYDKAEPAFLELIQLQPADYHSYAKLIQIYYNSKEYEKARPYRDKLYDAYKKGELKDNMKEMFCFDQFKWNGYLIQVFERYQNESKGDIYNKHLFYVVDSKEQIVFRVQTEFSPISVELGGPEYMLCATKGTTHYNSGLGFSGDIEYVILKSEAIKLFEQYIKQ